MNSTDSAAHMHDDTFELSVACPPTVIEAIAQRAAEIVLALQSGDAPEEAESPYMSIGEAAQYLRCSRQRIDNLLSARRLTRIKEGRRTLVDRREVEQYLVRAPRRGSP
jgi:excisionase family DNA binding protein